MPSTHPPASPPTTREEELAAAMRRAMKIIRDLEGGSLHQAAGKAHATLYEALQRVGHESGRDMSHKAGEWPDCSPLLCGHPSNPEPSR